MFKLQEFQGSGVEPMPIQEASQPATRVLQPCLTSPHLQAVTEVLQRCLPELLRNTDTAAEEVAVNCQIESNCGTQGILEAGVLQMWLVAFHALADF